MFCVFLLSLGFQVRHLILLVYQYQLENMNSLIFTAILLLIERYLQRNYFLEDMGCNWYVRHHHFIGLGIIIVVYSPHQNQDIFVFDPGDIFIEFTPSMIFWEDSGGSYTIN